MGVVEGLVSHSLVSHKEEEKKGKERKGKKWKGKEKKGREKRKGKRREEKRREEKEKKLMAVGPQSSSWELPISSARTQSSLAARCLTVLSQHRAATPEFLEQTLG